MNDLYFKVGADYSELQKLRQEVTLLENKIRTFKPGQAGPSLSQLQNQLSQTSARMRSLADSAALAGANIQKSIQNGVNGAIGAVYKLRDSLKDPITATLSIAGIGALGGLLSQITNVRKKFQDMQTSIDVMLGSEARGQKLMGQLTDFAKVSPLDFQGVVGAAKQMLGFNIEAEKVPKFLRAIGDVSMGDGARFRQLTLAFSQMSAAGKLMGQDLMQMVNAGFQPLQVMSEKTGKSIGQLKEEMSKGKISSEMVQQAFIDATSEGGKYYQMSEKASKTIGGQLSMLGDAFDLMYNDLGQKAEGTIVKVIEGATRLVENYDKFLPTLGAIIATFGVYKTSAMAAAFAEKAAVEEKNEAIKKGFDEQLRKLKEFNEEKAKGAVTGGTAPISFAEEDNTKGDSFVKGARYNADASRNIISQLSDGKMGDSTKIVAGIDNSIVQEKEKLKQSLANIDEQIRENNRKLKENLSRAVVGIKKEKEVLVNELADIDKEIAKKSTSLNDAKGNREHLEKVMKYQDISGFSSNWTEKDRQNHLDKAEQYRQEEERLKAEITALESRRSNTQNRLDNKDKDEEAYKTAMTSSANAENDRLKAQKDQLKEASAQVTEQLKKEKKEMSDLIAVDDAMSSAEGSKTYMKGQLDYMEKMYEGMSPEQQMSEFGQQVREQIDGIKAELKGVANLDSDLVEAIGLGDLAEKDAQAIQKERNNLDDYISSLKEKEQALKDAIDTSSDLAEDEAASIELNTVQKKINEAQTLKDSLAANQESIARLRSSGATNADTAAKTKNSVATTLLTAKTKAMTAWNHLCASAQQSLTNAVNAFKAAWATNPFGLILTGLTAVVSAFMAFKKTTDTIADEANENLKATLETRNNVMGLYATLSVADKNSQTYKKALEELKKVAKDYGIEVKDESKALDTLISKKERLIQLIMEEGKQRRYQARIENYTKQISDAQDELRDKLKGSIKGPHAELIAETIVENATNSMERLSQIEERLKKLNTEKISDSEIKLAGGISQAVKARQNERLSLASERKRLLMSGVGQMAKELGVSFDDKIIDKSTGSVIQFTKSAGDASKEMGMVAKNLENSKNNAESLADAAKKVAFKDMNLTELGKEAKSLAVEMDKISERAKSSKVKTDTSDAEKIISAIKKTNQSADEAKEKMDKLTDKTDEAQKKADNLSDTTVAPKTDNTALSVTKDLTEALGRDLKETETERIIPVDDKDVQKAQTDTEALKDELQNVDNSTAQPTIDTTSIMNAITQLRLVQTIVSQINGTKMTGYNTPEELARIKELQKKMKKLPGGGYAGTKAEIAEYNLLTNVGRSRASFMGKDLTPEEAQMMSYFRDYTPVMKADGTLDYEKTKAGLMPFQILKKDGTISVNTSKLQGAERDIWKQAVAHIDQRYQADADKKTQDEWAKMKKDIKSRMTKAQTDNDVAPLKKMLEEMKGDTRYNGAQRKWIEQQIETLNKRGKKSTDDPKQREFEKEKARLEEEKKARRDIQDAEFTARELELAKEIDNSEKEIKSIRLNAEKQKVQLDRQLEDKVQQMKEFDRNQWLKDFPAEAKKKNYMWEQSVSDEEYTRLAKERLGYDTQKEKIDHDEQSSMEKILKEDREAMNQYLMEYGSFEERRAAMAEYYSEKIKHAKNEAERLRLEREYNDKTLKADRDAYVQLLKEYGDYEQKKLAIDLDYQERMRNASSIEKANLELAKRREEEGLENEYGVKWNEAGINTSMFEYLDNLNIDVLDKLREKLIKLIQDSSVSADTLKDASAKLNDVENAISSRKSGWKNLNPFRNSNADQKEALERNASNKRTLADTLQEKANKQSEELNKTMEQLISTLKGKGVSMTKKDIEEGKANNPELLSLFEGEDKKAFGDLLSKTNAQSAEAAATAAEAAEAAQGAEAAEGAAAAGGGGGAPSFAITDAIIHGVNDNLQSMPELLEKWGLDDTEFGRGMKDFAESSQYATDAFDSLKSGNIIGVISNLHSAFGSLGKVLGRLGIGGMGASDANLERDIERLTGVNIELTRAVSNLADKMDDASISDVTAIYEQQKQYLQDSISNTKEMMSRSAASYNNGFWGIGGKKSSNHKINDQMSRNDWDRISKVVGFSVRSASDFFSLSSENMAKIADMAPDLYYKIKNLADDGYGDAAQFMDDYIEMYKQLEELQEAYLEHLTSFSFDDVKNEFSSLLADMSSSSADFAKNFETMMQKAIINSLMKEKYEERLKQWYKNFAADMENDGTISAQEQARRRAEYEQIVKDAVAERDELVKAMGWDSQYSQSGGANAYASMSQDTAEELNGRMTAIAVTTEAIREQNVMQNVVLSTMRDGFMGMMAGSDTVLEQVSSVATTLAKSSLDIAEIRDNTFVIIKPIKQMSDNIKDIKDNMKNL